MMSKIMSKKPLVVNLVRAYEITDDDKGYRILVDRIWPRGIKKEELQLDAWPKNLAPSTELRNWFNHQPERWDAFREKYFQELKGQEKDLQELLASAGDQPMLLIFGARDAVHNNAVALRDYLINLSGWSS
jgi:uncharacterized protein YeaO (DUF488 family)